MLRRTGFAAPPTRKLAQVVSLSADEVTVLRDLQSTIRFVRRNREIISEGRKYDGLLVLIEGVSIRYRVLHDGDKPTQGAVALRRTESPYSTRPSPSALTMT